MTDSSRRFRVVRFRLLDSDPRTDGQRRVAVVRAHLILKGKTLTSLAAELGVTDRWLNYVLMGQRKGERVRQAVAREMGVEYEELWG